MYFLKCVVCIPIIYSIVLGTSHCTVLSSQTKQLKKLVPLSLGNAQQKSQHFLTAH